MDGAMPLEISVGELAQWRGARQAHVVLDVRENWEVALCSLADSTAIPLASLPRFVDTLPRDVPLVVLCHHGMRSGHAVAWLRANGFDNATNLAGGIDAWARLVDREMGTY
jgi:rhodanese-related sulfurtransferase